MALFLEPLSQLPSQGRLASTLQAGKHDDRRGVFAKRTVRVCPPRISTSSSLTILTICWVGLSALESSSPWQRSLMAATNSLTTDKLTSASSRAMRIWRVVASISASVRRPLPRNPLKVDARRSWRVSNTVVLQRASSLPGQTTVPDLIMTPGGNYSPNWPSHCNDCSVYGVYTLTRCPPPASKMKANCFMPLATW